VLLRPASWPEAIDVAVQGLRAAGASTGVLTGGRLPMEDAYAYAKFARAVLGTNNVDFRARPHSDEEADFLVNAVAGSGLGVTFADLENASNVLLVAFEPEEEAGALFLRLRKAYRKKGLATWTIAPFLSNGARKLGAALVGCVPGMEASVLTGSTRRPAPAATASGGVASGWSRSPPSPSTRTRSSWSASGPRPCPAR
jgi:NADH-quinone oxidoreductase subunit G